MTRNRYDQWMAVFKCIYEHKSSLPAGLYDQLNGLWQEERARSSPEQLAAYSQPLELENDPEFRKFLDDLNKGFSN